jgi:hypothetical protein
MKSRFSKGCLDGEGVRTYENGKQLKGIWSKNELINGKLINIDETTYEGEWLGGRPHGTGVKTISGGKRYEGMFYLGRPWGSGCKLEGTESNEGYWEANRFIKAATSEQQFTEFRLELSKATVFYQTN